MNREILKEIVEANSLTYRMEHKTSLSESEEYARNLMRKYFPINEEYDMLYFRNGHNPIVEDFILLKENKLVEGYYKTYPVDVMLRYISTMFGTQIIDANAQEYDGYMVVRIKIDKHNYNNLNKAMMLCGYNLDMKEDAEDGTIILQYSPIYTENLSDNVYGQKYLYHVTPSYNKKRILQSGLFPKSSNDIFDYPGRVYLFLGNNVDTTTLISNAYDLYTAKPRVNNPKDDRYNKDIIWTIVKVDVSKLPENIKFYNDPLWDKMAVYTYDNIPPSAIIETNDYYL